MTQDVSPSRASASPRRAAAVLAAIAMAVLPFASAVADEAKQASSRGISGVVELFTSQGCSSCPPAEEVLQTLAGDPALVAIAYHVDYWDYIGWDDTFGSRANTDRQRAYAAAFGSGTIYTPQMVVNGTHDIVGSHGEEIRQALAKSKLGQDGAPTIELAVADDHLHIEVAEGGAGRQVKEGGAKTTLVLTLVTFDAPSKTAIERGENGGRTLLNVNPVRDWRTLGMWAGKPLAVDIPLSDLRRGNKGKGGCAAILQSMSASGALGPILSAAVLKF